MKTHISARFISLCRNVGTLLFAAYAAIGAEPNAAKISLEPAPNTSLRNEVNHAIDKGLAFLEKTQDTNGFWSLADQPAVTALALTSFEGRPGGADQKPPPPVVEKGYAFLLSCVQPDGGIYRKDLPSYNTSVALSALVAANRPEYQPMILNARKFLIGLQSDLGDPSDGGIGYGGGEKDKRPDLSNTMLALEALYYSKPPGESKAGSTELNLQAAMRFIQACQNLPTRNPEKWASDDPQNKGGFVYAPGRSMAGETNLPSGRVALRSYGTMSYAGLLSYIYADLKLNDPRVTAVLDWLRANYSIDENPGLGPQGIYYYYVLMAKALTLCNIDTLAAKDGRNVNWREQLALKLLNMQRGDGSWTNENGRWWEKDPALDSAFALIALEIIQRRL